MDNSRFDSYDNSLEDCEYPDEDYDDDEEVDLVECPECGAEVYEDAVACPVCGTYITHSTSVWEGKSLAWVVIGLLGILAVIYVFTMG